jgi:hypothetical protein
MILMRTNYPTHPCRYVIDGMIHSEIIKSGKYKFKVTRNIQMYRDQILIHTYKVGGDFSDCVNISYFYEDNKPVRVTVYLLYEPECFVGSTLDSGGGTELMIKAAINHAYNDVKTLSNFEFEDNSHIDCVENGVFKPLNLPYFYIAYHGLTWYEARFNAEMIDKTKYKMYKERLKFLTDVSEKVSYEKFLSMVGSTFDSLETATYLEKLYNKAATYREFFENIPKSKRYDILYPWLNTFMENYIGSVFDVKGWVINADAMDTTVLSGGSLTKGGNYRIFSYRKIHTV